MLINAVHSYLTLYIIFTPTPPDLCIYTYPHLFHECSFMPHILVCPKRSFFSHVVLSVLTCTIHTCPRHLTHPIHCYLLLPLPHIGLHTSITSITQLFHAYVPLITPMSAYRPRALSSAFICPIYSYLRQHASIHTTPYICFPQTRPARFYFAPFTL